MSQYFACWRSAPPPSSRLIKLGGEGRESNPPGTLRPPDWF